MENCTCMKRANPQNGWKVWFGGERKESGNTRPTLEAQVRLYRVQCVKYFGLDPVGSGEQSIVLLGRNNIELFKKDNSGSNVKES